MEILERVKSLLPKEAVSRAELEGSEIIVYTKDREFFKAHEDTVRQVVSQIKKRIEIRPEKNLVLDEEATKEKIKEIVPEDAKIKEIYFEPERSIVIIAAQKPGLVIGRGGETFRTIRSETLWMPRIERVPAIKSDIVENIRKVIHTEVKFRKDFLNKVGELIFSDRKSNRDWVRIIGLGGWREVGRSAALLETPKSKVLIDCGIKAGAMNSELIPIFNTKEFDYNELDAVVISHSHLDHVGAVPMLYEYGFTGPLYMTTPALDLATLLWFDYVDVMQKSGTTPLYTVRGIKEAVKHAIPLEYSEVSDVAPDIRLTFQNAGHILGCVTGDTLVMLDDGTITEMKKLCNPHPRLVGAKVMDENMMLTNSEAVVFQKNYFSDLYKIKTQVGNIVVTDEHPFFTLDNGNVKEIKASDLTSGTFIAAPRIIHVKGDKQKLTDFQKSVAHNSIHIIPLEFLTDDLAQLVGYVLGDGGKAWTGRKGRKLKSGALNLHDQDRELLILYKGLLEKVFKFSKTPKMPITPRKGTKGLKLEINCSEILNFFESNFGEALERSPQRKIPEIITRCENSQVRRFLRGLFDAEGSVLVGNSNLELTITSKNIAYGTMLLLLRFGILSSLKEKKNYGWGEKLYRLTITDRDSIELFNELIGFDHGGKKRKLEELVKKPKHPTRQSATNVVPSLGKTLRRLRKNLKINRHDCVVSIKHFEETHSASYPSLQKLFDQFYEKFEKLKRCYKSEIASWKDVGDVIKEGKITKYELGKLLNANSHSVSNWIKGRHAPLSDKINEVRTYIKEKLKYIIENEDTKKDLDLLRTFLRSEVRWVKIDRIEKIENKDKKVYDLYVPKYHSFISNGLISHNSSLIHLHVGEGMHNIVYALDQKFGRTTLLDPAFTDFQRVETLILESTYGGAQDIMPNRADTERELMGVVDRTMERNGIVLIPSFSVERAQEVMAILVEHGIQYPVYLDGMIWDANGIFTAYPEYLGRNIQKKIFQGDDPFLSPIFKRIASQQEREKAWEDKPCVIVSTSGMLTGGPVMSHLHQLAENPNNTLLFVGWQSETSLGRRIQNGWKELPVPADNGRMTTVELKMEVQTIHGLSGHSDKNQLLGYVGHLSSKPDRVICVHGDAQKTQELARAINRIFRIPTDAPRDLEALRLR